MNINTKTTSSDEEIVRTYLGNPTAGVKARWRVATYIRDHKELPANNAAIAQIYDRLVELTSQEPVRHRAASLPYWASVEYGVSPESILELMSSLKPEAKAMAKQIYQTRT